MKKRALVTVFALAASVVFAGDLSREAKVEKILDLTNARAMQDQVMGQIKQMAAQQMPANMTEDQRVKANDLQKRMLDLIANRMDWDKLRPMMVKIWADTFTDQELDGMLAFYESPAGRGMMQKMPAVMVKTMQQVQAIVGDLQPEIEKAVKETLGKP